MKRIFTSSLLLLFALASFAQSASEVRRDFENRYVLVSTSDAQQALDMAETKEEREALEFLYAYMDWADIFDQTGEYFLENARKKAHEIAEISGCCALADDSGLCVDALGGAPGVHSARFAGEHGNDEANNALLLDKLRGVENRAAHFTCAIVLARPDGSEVSAEGYFPGVITEEPAGENGFGYDPLLFLPEYGCTSAQLAPEEKNRISHRGKALRALLEKLDGQA